MKNTRPVPSRPSRLAFLALACVLNIAGANLALFFRLPFYFDTFGTFLAAALLGPFYGMLPGLAGGLITGFVSDIYSLFFLPVQLVTGLSAGCFLYRTKPKPVGRKVRFGKGKKCRTVFPASLPLPFLALCISLPGTAVSSLISACLFGGVTSSGSTVFIQLLHHAGLGLTESVFCVQFFSDYADRFLMLYLSGMLIRMLPRTILSVLKKGNHAYGTLQ